MRILDFIRQDLIVPELQAEEKFGVLAELADHMAKTLGTVSSQALLRVLSEREKLASTAIGDGVAIPHGKLDAIGQLVACVGRATDGISFDSMDGKPTHLFFVLVAPENSTGSHLKALARISRLFKDPSFRSRLLRAKTAQDMYTALAEEDAKY